MHQQDDGGMISRFGKHTEAGTGEVLDRRAWDRSRIAPRFRVMAGIYPCPVSQVGFGALVLALEC